MALIPVLTPLPQFPVRGQHQGLEFSNMFRASMLALAEYIDEQNAAFPQLVAAASVANYAGTSTTSNTIDAGITKTFIVQDGKMFNAATYLIVADADAPTTNYFYGRVSSYNFLTGELVLNVISKAGAGTKNNWIVNLSGERGPQGIQGVQGLKGDQGNIGLKGDKGDIGPSGSITETLYPITASAAFEIDPANGGLQTVFLNANSIPKATNFTENTFVTLHITGNSFTATWNDATMGSGGVLWHTDGGNAPTFATSGSTPIVLWKLSGRINGARVGNR